MNSKNIQKNVSQSEFSDPLKGLYLSDVSKASIEIMLARFYNGKEIDFPFLYN
tara:strand:- start:567 stop:725 length:159 start_codon:yes stop_codon:yes gene_type:complete